MLNDWLISTNTFEYANYIPAILYLAYSYSDNNEFKEYINNSVGYYLILKYFIEENNLTLE
jgi:hypothetical protein